jgi:hypothetical protein
MLSKGGKVQSYVIPDVFEIPAPENREVWAWLVALAVTSIIFGAALGLVLGNDVPPGYPDVTVGH